MKTKAGREQHRSLAVVTLISAVLAIILGPSADSRADAGANSNPNSTTRPSVTVPEARTAPKLDAQVDDPAWASAASIDHLSPCLGTPESAPAPQATTLRLLWDADWLYVRFDCTADTIYAPYGQERDKMHCQGDAVEIFIDPVGDARQFVEIQISPENGVYDSLYLLTAEPRSGPDLVLLGDVINKDQWALPEWNMEGLKSSARLRKTADGKGCGWIAEVGIPAKALLKRLGTQHFKPMTLRANFIRCESHLIPGQDSTRQWSASNWAAVVSGRPHRSPAAMGFVELSR